LGLPSWLAHQSNRRCQPVFKSLDNQISKESSKPPKAATGGSNHGWFSIATIEILDEQAQLA